MSATTNDIGTPGELGFGVGIAPYLPDGYQSLPGTHDPASDEYGNYRFQDGSIMVYTPHFEVAFKDGRPLIVSAGQSAPKSANVVQMAAFYNGGKRRDGFFMDKYLCSRNGNVASSIKRGRVLTSYARKGHPDTPFSSLGQGIKDNYGGAFDAAKTRGDQFFVSSFQMRVATGMLVVAQRQAGRIDRCAWLSATSGWPVGCTSGDLSDERMRQLRYEGDGTWNCGLTGSASIPAAVAHNGQACGVMDLSGLVWEIQSGVGERDGRLAFISPSDHLEEFHLNKWVSSGQEVSMPKPGWSWIDPSRIGADGWTDAFVESDCGAGGVWALREVPRDLCVISGGSWSYGANAGVWALLLTNVRGNAGNAVGLRAASYL